jgi:peptidoglycan DL-endopeptidase CwlO
VTTGTVAVSGVALAGCGVVGQHDGNGLDEASVTSPIRLGAVAAVADEAQGNVLRVQPLRRTILRAKDVASLTIKRADITTKADSPVDVAFQLIDSATHKPLANQKIRVQRKTADGWATFKYVQTDQTGNADYTAHVLTTTQITAVFDGSDTHTAAHAGTGTLTVTAPVVTPTAVARAAQPAIAAATTMASSTVTTPASVPASVPASSIGAKAVYLASMQQGKPYVYGAAGPYSFDCSGLVQYVFKQIGRSLPRTAEEQYEATTHVSQYAKQPGDLIFFGAPGSVYHVGIYAGNGMMWDAAHTGTTVALQSIWTTDYEVGRV